MGLSEAESGVSSIGSVCELVLPVLKWYFLFFLN